MASANSSSWGASNVSGMLSINRVGYRLCASFASADLMRLSPTMQKPGAIAWNVDT